MESMNGMNGEQQQALVKPPKTAEQECHEHVRAGFVSYLVSAPLHGRGSIAFWQEGVQNMDFYGIITRGICIFDLFWHVALWLVLLIFEIWTYTAFQNNVQVKAAVPEIVADPTATPPVIGVPAVPKAEYHMADADGAAGSRVLLDELFVGEFGAFLIAFTGLVISIVFGFMGQPSGKAWPSTICFLFGGIKASLAFTVLIILVASDKWHGFNSVTDVSADGNQETVTMRQMLLWGVLLKCLLLAQLSANEKFWGSASDDDTYANFCFLLKGLQKDDITHRTLRGEGKWGPSGHYASAGSWNQKGGGSAA